MATYLYDGMIRLITNCKNLHTKKSRCKFAPQMSQYQHPIGRNLTPPKQVCTYEGAISLRLHLLGVQVCAPKLSQYQHPLRRNFAPQSKFAPITVQSA